MNREEVKEFLDDGYIDLRVIDEIFDHFEAEIEQLKAQQHKGKVVAEFDGVANRVYYPTQSTLEIDGGSLKLIDIVKHILDDDKTYTVTVTESEDE